MSLAVSFGASAASISSKSLTLTTGQTETLRVKGMKKVTWKSNKKAVATVSKKGKVTAVSAGTAKITAKSGKKKLTCKVTVLEQNTSAGSAGNRQAAAQTAQTAQKTNKSGLNTSTAGMDPEQARVFSILLSFRSSFPEGKTWTNSDFYAWKGGTYRGGYGCAAFAFLLSDAAFGTVKATMHKNVRDIKVGDILRVDNNTHSVIVLRVESNGVVVAEGNYNESIHWGRTISNSELSRSLDYVMTRYADC